MYEIKNIDCFEYLKTLNSKSINLFLLDLPYGQTACGWDTKIDLNKMWELIKQKITENGQVVFFCTTRFGIELINSNPSWFRYDLVWEKRNIVGQLSANKMPLRQHEMIYIFSDCDDDLEIKKNLELREYSKRLKEQFNIVSKDFKKISGNLGLSHFFSFNGVQYGIPTKENYDKLVEHYNLDKLDYYIDYETLKNKWDINNKKVYNPQKTEGKPYINIRKVKKNTNYGNYIASSINNNGDRYPTTILKFGYDKEKYHTTQKPVLLLEWLIKTYSNKNDNICDFTMGIGGACIACLNTNRNFYGCELDKEIYEIAKERIESIKI